MQNEIMSIKSKVRKYILEEYFEDENDGLDDDSPLISSGIIDSISILQMVDFLEEAFNFEFEPHEVDHSNLNSVNLITAFVQSKTK